MPATNTTRSRKGKACIIYVLILFAIMFLAALRCWEMLRTDGHGGETFNEVSKLYSATQTFSEKFGRLPPDTGDERRFRRFLRCAFPDYEVGIASPLPKNLDAAEALVFWLSRVGTDAKDPFAADAQERYTLFEFPESRVREGRFYPPSEGEMDPYIYFYYEDYDRAEYKGFRPYWRKESEDGRFREYFAPETCQIVGPGPDGKLGRGGLITELSEADRDNVVSFDTRPVGEIELGR